MKPNEFGHIQRQVLAIEEGLPADASRSFALHQLQELGLNDYLQTLWYMPDARYPRLSAALPAMASPEVQMQWTGQSDLPLIIQTTSFVRSTAEHYVRLQNQPLTDKKILDFGCGYGRMLRAFSFYSYHVYGVDPWSESIRICNEAGLTESVFLSDYLPDSLPVPDDFDFVFAFSVFTHLSERATKKNLAAMRNHMKVGALACITIRPVEYWSHVYGSEPKDWLEARWNEHREKGFTFQPHQQRETVDGDITYGDTSMTIEWLMSVADGFELAAVDRSSDDEYQRYVFLRAIPFEQSASRPNRSAVVHRRRAPGQLVHETRTVDLVRTVLSRLKSRLGA